MVSVVVLVLSVYSGLSDNHSYVALSKYSLSQLILSNTGSGAFMPNFISSITATLYYYLYMIAMGLTFSVLAMLSFVANAVSIGYLLSHNAAGMNFLLPQSIFTFVASVFAMCGAFLVTKMEVRFIGYLINSKKNPLTRLKAPLKDLILSITLMLVFVIIYAILNATLAPMLY